jgi:hypothetical protein
MEGAALSAPQTFGTRRRVSLQVSRSCVLLLRRIDGKNVTLALRGVIERNLLSVR